MNILLVAGLIIAVPLFLFYLSHTKATKEKDKNDQEKLRREANERALKSQRKLHEAEKKRWEDDYWKRQPKGTS